MKVGIFKDKYFLDFDGDVYRISENGFLSYIGSSSSPKIIYEIIEPDLGVCEFCGKKEKVYNIYGKLICKDCIKYNVKRCCNFCSYTNIFLKRFYGKLFCPICYSKRFVCDDCGYVGVRCERNGVQIGKKIYCANCYMKHYPVHRYSFIPNLQFNKVNSNDSGFAGVELEVEFDEKDPSDFGRIKYMLLSKIAKKALLIKKYFRKKKLNLFYLKMDATISGVEFVSHPFTYNWFQKNKNKIKRLFTFLKKIGGVSYKYGRAGLHIHLSKKNFSNSDYLKLFFFYHHHYDKVVKIAQRGDGYYCRFKKIPGKQFIQYYKRELNSCLSNFGDHHYAINFSHDKPTIELRFFRGTLNFRVFCGIIDFVFAVKDFIKFYSAFTIGKENSWNIFLDFCKKNGYRDFVKLWDKLNKIRKPITDKSR